MSDQPYEGGPYQGYDPHQQQYQQYPQQAPHVPQAWPGQEQGAPGGYGRADQADQYAGQQDPAGYDPHATQQWQGRTWETQTHAPVTADPARPAPQGPYQHPHQAEARHRAQGPGDAYGQPYQAHQPYAGHAVSPEAGAGTSHAGRHAAVPGPAPAPAASGDLTGSGDDPDYGPATLAGNARITDAQRARLEGRSPVIEPGMQPAALTALLGLLLAVAASLSSYALVVPLVLLQAVTAAGWFRLNGMWPARQGIALAFLGGLVADAAVLVAGRAHASAAILGTLGVWVLLCLVLQLRSHADADERMYGLMATVVSAALTIIATGFLGADPDGVSVGAAAVAVAVLARALPLPTPASVAVAVLAAAGAGIAVGGMTGLGARGALLGAGAAVCALIGHRAASYDYPSRFVHFTAGVALPLAAAAPAVWLLGRALG